SICRTGRSHLRWTRIQAPEDSAVKKLPLALALTISAAFAASAQALPHSNATGLSHRNSCGVAAGGAARCHAEVVTGPDGRTFRGRSSVSGAPAGWHSSDLQSAYKLTNFLGAGAGRT